MLASVAFEIPRYYIVPLHPPVNISACMEARIYIRRAAAIYTYQMSEGESSFTGSTKACFPAKWLISLQLPSACCFCGAMQASHLHAKSKYQTRYLQIQGASLSDRYLKSGYDLERHIHLLQAYLSRCAGILSVSSTAPHPPLERLTATTQNLSTSLTLSPSSTNSSRYFSLFAPGSGRPFPPRTPRPMPVPGSGAEMTVAR